MVDAMPKKNTHGQTKAQGKGKGKAVDAPTRKKRSPNAPEAPSHLRKFRPMLPLHDARHAMAENMKERKALEHGELLTPMALEPERLLLILDSSPQSNKISMRQCYSRKAPGSVLCNMFTGSTLTSMQITLTVYTRASPHVA